MSSLPHSSPVLNSQPAARWGSQVPPCLQGPVSLLLPYTCFGQVTELLRACFPII